MEPLIDAEYLLKTFATLTVVGQALIGVWLLGAIAKKFQKRDNWITSIMGRKGLMAAWIAALLATAGSLAFSELALLNPCELCWFQRIMMYPLVVTLGTALFSKKDARTTLTASMILAIVGALIAFYHYLEQFGFAPVNLPCSVVGYSPACSDRFETMYGYVTIPLMSLTAFVMIVVSLAMRGRQR